MEHKLDEIIKILGLSPRFTFSSFVLRLEQHLSKRFVFYPWEFPAHITGACLESENTIYIFFDETASPIHQIIIKLHEILHVILGYRNSGLSKEEEDSVKHSIIGTGYSYRQDIDNFVMRNINQINSSIEREIDDLALLLTQRLLPERSDAEDELVQMNLD